MTTLDVVEGKEQIVVKYIPLVKYIASRVSLGKNKYMEYEDLVSYGMIGLMDAIFEVLSPSEAYQYLFRNPRLLHCSLV